VLTGRLEYTGEAEPLIEDALKEDGRA
jgi:hypothetical protein